VKKAVLLYGICGGVLIAALRLAEYRFLVIEHSIEIYGGLIALLFASVGIWLGLTITKTEVVVIREVPVPAVPFTRNDAKVSELGITPRELETIYFKLWPGFFDKYAAYAIEKARASGATQQALDQTAAQMKTYKELYDRPLINAAISFIEPLPVGLLVTLVSAGVLRRKG